MANSEPPNRQYSLTRDEFRSFERFNLLHFSTASPIETQMPFPVHDSNLPPVNFAAMSYTEMIDFFVDHVFFEFMAHGRTGLESGVFSTVISLCIWTVGRSEHTTEPFQLLSAKVEDQVKRDSVKLATDGFVRAGSLGLRTAVQSMRTLVYHAMSEEAKLEALKKDRAAQPKKVEKDRAIPACGLMVHATPSAQHSV